MRETYFEKSEVLNGFINDITKSRNKVFCSGEGGENGEHMMFLIKDGETLNGGWVETFKDERRFDTMKDTMS